MVPNPGDVSGVTIAAANYAAHGPTDIIAKQKGVARAGEGIRWHWWSGRLAGARWHMQLAGRVLPRKFTE
jgi:hypothetical protein